MYGYVRPERGELKIREYETFHGVYCGLCHALKQRYGPIWRFAVNYDLTFLAMLLAGPETPETCRRRCPYHPLGKTLCPASLPALDAAADDSVILAWWKMRDGVSDKGFFGSLGCRIACAVMKRPYHKAAERRPAFARAVEGNIRALEELENARCESLDAAADKFALILRAAADGAEGSDRARVLSELLYHVGRIVYALDAADDLADDEKKGAYNPLRYRFALRDGKLAPEDEAELRKTLQHSHNSVCAAFALLDKNPYTDILSNIIYFGLPAVTQAVFDGTWKRNGRGDARSARAARLGRA